jgi:hypothetical protein
MKKRAFVPNSDLLESRVVLSSGPKFIGGAAVLTPNALGKAYSQIDKAFTTFATHGQNYGRLNSDLAKAINLIPYNRRDGLWDEVKSEVASMQSDISSGVSTPVVGALQRVKADLNSFVQDETSSGVIIVTGGGGGSSSTHTGGGQFNHGAAVLTTRALGKAYSQIGKAYTTFATHGQNYGRLNADLAKAVSVIPYNRRDGLWDEVQSEISTLQSDISSGVSTPVVSAIQRTNSDLKFFVQDEVSSGVIVVR